MANATILVPERERVDTQGPLVKGVVFGHFVSADRNGARNRTSPGIPELGRLPGGFACRFPSESGSKPICFIVKSTDYDRILSIDKNISATIVCRPIRARYTCFSGVLTRMPSSSIITDRTRTSQISGPAHHRISAENAYFYRANANSKIEVSPKVTPTTLDPL